LILHYATSQIIIRYQTNNIFYRGGGRRERGVRIKNREFKHTASQLFRNMTGSVRSRLQVEQLRNPSLILESVK
jgi:hypothetical protein